MEAIEHQVVLFLQNLIQSVGWAGIVLAMAIESACIPLPSEVTMPLAGWMLVQGESSCSSRAIENGALDLDVAQFRVQQPPSHAPEAARQPPRSGHDV